jgi:hypothetical protein
MLRYTEGGESDLQMLLDGLIVTLTLSWPKKDIRSAISRSESMSPSGDCSESERMSQHGPWDTAKDENGLRKLSSCSRELVVVCL